MRRYALGAATVALLVAMSGCGGGGASTTALTELPQQLQMQLGGYVQTQLRTSLHDRAVEARTIRCVRQPPNAFLCRVRLTDGPRRRGTVSLNVTVDPTTHRVGVAVTNASNRRWLAAMRRAR